MPNIKTIKKNHPQSEVSLKMKFRNFLPLKWIPGSGTGKIYTQEGVGPFAILNIWLSVCVGDVHM